MTKDNKETLEETIIHLAKKAMDNTNDSNDAMRYGQAVLNVSNALIGLSIQDKS